MAHDGRSGSDLSLARELLAKIMTDASAAKEMVAAAEKLGRGLSSKLTTSQIRAIFDEVRTIEGMWAKDPAVAQRKLRLLKPKMQYRAAREKKGVPELVAVLDPAVDIVLDSGGSDGVALQRFRNFVEFFEAILAYHRAGGGR